MDERIGAGIGHEPEASQTPGDVIRAIRKSQDLTLSELSERTGLAVSTLSKVEKGHVSLSYDKLVSISKGLGVDVARLLDASHSTGGASTGSGRRVVQRAGQGTLVETHSYRQQYMATELLNKRMTPIIVELRARTKEEFFAEFGGFIRHPGEEFALVLSGTADFRSELYTPVLLGPGDSIYFDSEMGHAYLKASDEPCHVLSVCLPRGSSDDRMVETFVNASERLAARQQEPVDASAPPRTRRVRRH